MIGNKNNKAKSKKNLYTLVIENMTKRSAQASLMITCDISKEENMSESIRRNSSHLTRLSLNTSPKNWYNITNKTMGTPSQRTS